MIKTAYTETTAFEHDNKPFTTPQGKLFNAIESNGLEKRLQAFGKTGSIVEVGYGTGRFLSIAAAYCKQITGIDPSKDMLQLAGEKVADHPSAKLLEGEGAAIPLKNGSQDFVYSIRTLNQVENTDYALKMIKDLFRICKPGGCVLMEILNKKSLNRTTDNTQSHARPTWFLRRRYRA